MHETLQLYKKIGVKEKSIREKPNGKPRACRESRGGGVWGGKLPREKTGILPKKETDSGAREKKGIVTFGGRDQGQGKSGGHK